MAARADQLPSLLANSLAPVYLLAGSEPLLMQESRDLIIQAAQQEGFTERNVYDVRKGFDWDLLAEDSAAQSLFASRKIVDLRIPTGRPGREGSQALVDMVEAGDPDILLLVSCEKWETSQRKAKWVTTIGKQGVFVEIWPVKPQQLPGWIRNRMVQAGLEPEPEAVAMLAELVEGNLLAAQQEIDKMLLAGQDRTVTADDVTRAVADSSRFDAFRLVECMLAGRLAESLRVASGLRRTGVAIQAVSGALYRELSLTHTVSLALQAGKSDSAAFSELRIWPARQGPMRQALGRLSAEDLGISFRALALIDRQSKGRAGGDPWQTLDRMLCFLSDPASPSPV